MTRDQPPLALAGSMHKTDRRGAHERIRVIGQKRIDSIGVTLPLLFVWCLGNETSPAESL